MSTEPKAFNHGANPVPAKPGATPIATSHAGTRRNPATNPLPAQSPLPPDPLDAVKTGLRDITGELDAMTKTGETIPPEARERLGRAQTRLAQISGSLEDHVENLKKS